MSIGSLTFLNPPILLALLALPLIWWLLRATPPAPSRIPFPAIRLLKGLINRDTTPARSPWWLTLIRMLAAALLIGALSEPVLNAFKGELKGSGPVVLVVDNGWAAAGHWEERQQMLSLLVADAERQSRPVILVPTAQGPRKQQPVLESPKAALDRITTIEPLPYAPDRLAAAEALAAALEQHPNASIFWLSDGLEGRDASAFAERLVGLAGSGGQVSAVLPSAGREALGVRRSSATGGKLAGEILSPGTAEHEGVVLALSSRGQRLGEARFRLAAGAQSVAVELDLPLELRNQVARLELAGVRSAGAVHLLGSGARWNRVGLVSGVGLEQSQPLLSPLYYIERALLPYAELVRDDDANTASAIESLLRQNVSVMMLADIGNLVGATLERVSEWVDNGGILVRFAGPRLEQGGDALMPVALRLGGRALGGALSWSTPQPLGTFESTTPFAGLVAPPDVLISRQVLADPALLQDDNLVWARLADGTPLVTAQKRGSGWIVLFHVTASPEWSNLPISGLFVEMLQRVIGLTGLAAPAGRGGVAAAEQAATAAIDPAVLAPVETLNGFGQLGAPPATAQPLPAEVSAQLEPSAVHPPGLYGPPGKARALNVVGKDTTLAALRSLPSGMAGLSYRADEARPLKPSLFLAAIGLVMLDILAVMALQAGVGLARARKVAAAVAMLVAAVLLTPEFAQAQETPAAGAGGAPLTDDAFALKAALKTHFAYVVTGDAETDETSRLGLAGLARVLNLRTAVQNAEPMGVDITRDELSFFPILYWPVTSQQQELDEAAATRVNAFMREGGLIIFDTRDLSQATLSLGGVGPGTEALQRVTSRLDIPRLEPVPPDHVLGKSFYLLRSFPGRFDGGETWVEATDTSEAGAERQRHTDGVSSIIITSNDLAAAWAMDDDGRPLYAVVPGGEEQREMAYRVGVNIVMYALTGNYKADQVHVPALLERLGQ